MATVDVAVPRRRRNRRLDELVGIALLFVAALALLSLLSYDHDDASWFHRPASPSGHENWMGRTGTVVGEALLQCFGVASFLLPLLLTALGWSRLRGRNPLTSVGKVAGHLLVLLAVAALAHLLYGTIQYGGETFGAGGNLVGAGLAATFSSLLGRAGAVLLASALLAAGIVVATHFSFADALGAGGRAASGAGRRGLAALQAFLGARRRKAEKAAVIRKHQRQAAVKARALARAAAEPEEASDARKAEPEEGDGDTQKPAPRARPRVVALPPRPAAAAPPPAPKQGTLPMEPAEGGVALPPLELLKEPEPHAAEEEAELLARAHLLAEKLREFQVDGQVVAIHPGPVVTTFEFKPEAGVKYSKITSLVDDLCLGLKAESVRIDRLPGKSTVGIEVPNRRQETIYPRELMASERFRASGSKLTLALGKDISGEVYVSELDRMPHLLIAGATGAGKSVCLNSLITSILYKSTPADVRFIMIDTKMIELGIYADIPHMLIPVVTEPKLASTALKWAVKEMESRYRQLASCGVRNIGQFNDLLEAEPDRAMTDERTGASVPLKHLPYVVIVIDEMADLMMVSSADVEESVMRLAQMARAVGIHLILATQRPSVDVITGTIKANFPARIAFRVSQRVDSRTIIDQGGAEQLLGRGDMLFLPPGMARLLRLHGGYITESEIHRITTFLKKQAKPVFDESILKEAEEERAGYESGERDTMFVEAVRLVLQEGLCSITLIQRRLRLGYARAARIVDTMEQEGIIGPADGSRPREVLAGPEILETLEAPR
ncbi:MAG TPA: DNA translocase FtsK 4TM domain-containing protein [Candidatus Polarisedimenticolaceae bacterium]|nr:DNA translocase FtsK 4TM domain-containing protein [Candidatus Polarisedimenticolaceae bacterium]